MTRWRTRIYYSLPPGCVSSGEISLGDRQPQSKSDNFISHEYRAILWTGLVLLPGCLGNVLWMVLFEVASRAFLLTQPEGTRKIRNSIFSTLGRHCEARRDFDHFIVTYIHCWQSFDFWLSLCRTPGLWTDTGDRNGPNPHATRTAIELSIGRGWRYLFVSTGWPAVQCVLYSMSPVQWLGKMKHTSLRALSFERRTGHGIKVISFGFNPQLVSHFNWTGDSQS